MIKFRRPKFHLTNSLKEDKLKIEDNSLGIKATIQIILDEIHSVLEKIDEKAYGEFISSILPQKCICYWTGEVSMVSRTLQ